MAFDFWSLFNEALKSGEPPERVLRSLVNSCISRTGERTTIYNGGSVVHNGKTWTFVALAYTSRPQKDGEYIEPIAGQRRGGPQANLGTYQLLHSKDIIAAKLAWKDKLASAEIIRYYAVAKQILAPTGVKVTLFNGNIEELDEVFTKDILHIRDGIVEAPSNIRLDKIDRSDGLIRARQMLMTFELEPKVVTSIIEDLRDTSTQFWSKALRKALRHIDLPYKVLCNEESCSFRTKGSRNWYKRRIVILLGNRYLVIRQGIKFDNRFMTYTGCAMDYLTQKEYDHA